MEYDWIHGVERFFLSWEDLQPQDKEFNIMLKVGHSVSWALKFRHSGLIYNRLDLVLSDCISCNGTVTIRDMTTLHNLVVGETTLDEEIKHENVKIQASSEIVSILKARFACISPSSSSLLTGTNASSASGGKREYRNLPANNNPSSLNNATNNSNYNTNNNSDDSPPLKTGWLLKKRDIISGWKRRYFEVYMDRLDYFASSEDTRPRGSYPLYGVEVSAVRPIGIKRKFEHYGIFLDLRYPEKTIKLATEKAGLEGRAEADSWYQIFKNVANNRSKAVPQSKTGNKNSNKRLNHSASGSNVSVPAAAAGLRSPITHGSNGMGDKVVRFVRRLTSPKKHASSKTSSTSSSSQYILQKDGSKESSSLWQMLLYGGGIVGLSVALVYAWWVQKSLSTKTFATLSVLMLVLLAIFVQEFILGDDGDDEHRVQESGMCGSDADNADTLARHNDSFDHGAPDSGDEDDRGWPVPKHTKEDLEDEDESDHDLLEDDDDDNSDEEAHAAAKARSSFKQRTPIR